MSTNSSLVLEGVGELLGDCGAPGVHLLLEYDYGDPQQVTAEVQALLLDGERVLSVRAGNRTIELPLIVVGTDRQNLSVRMDALLDALSDPGYSLTWTPDGGLAMEWQCFAAAWQISWDVRYEDKLFVQQVKVTIPALPYGRTPDPATAIVTPGSTSEGGHLFVLSDIVGSGRGPAAVEIQLGLGVDSWLLHKPPVDADPTAPILAAVSGGSTSVPDSERLHGTYVVVAGVSTYNAPGQPRTMQCTVTDDIGASALISRSYVSSLNLRPLIIGNITLPLVDRPAGSPITLNFVFDDHGGGGTGDTLVSAVMLLDTRGQVVASFDRQGDGYTESVWVDEGSITNPVGPIWNSPSALRSGGYAAKDLRLSGGPLSVSEDDNSNRLLVYAAGATPTVALSYHPHWLHERLV